jgi:hypothetical protein
MGPPTGPVAVSSVELLGGQILADGRDLNVADDVARRNQA